MIFIEKYNLSRE